jgi:MHS family proline/betaine transporter-like MFS transporter
MLAAAVGFVLTAYPSFRLLAVAPSVPVLIGVVCWLSLLKTLYSGALPSLMTELFPTRVRATAVALSYNVSVVIFGGFAPAIATALIKASGDQLAPAYYLTVAAAVSVGAMWAVRWRLGAR